jgi:hypothetical protein
MGTGKVRRFLCNRPIDWQISSIEARQARMSQYCRKQWRVGATLLLAALVLLATAEVGRAQAVKSRPEIERIAVVEKLAVQDGVVSGEVFNKSPYLLRDVQLLVRYTWLWDDEKKPGKSDPGTSTFYTLPREIAPGGRLPFTFKPAPPLPSLSGGHFEISVSIAGFAEVIPQTR